MKSDEHHEDIWARWEKAAKTNERRTVRACLRLLEHSDAFRDDAAFTLDYLLSTGAIRDEDVVVLIDQAKPPKGWWSTGIGKSLALAVDKFYDERIEQREEQAQQDHIDGTDKLVLYDMFED